MALTRPQTDARLQAIEARVPALLQDRNSFPPEFEDEAERLLAEVSDRDRDYALTQLEAIVERSGFNR
ncbi:hypothetical protein [Lysobacter tyrosinilyticus]